MFFQTFAAGLRSQLPVSHTAKASEGTCYKINPHIRNLSTEEKNLQQEGANSKPNGGLAGKATCKERSGLTFSADYVYDLAVLGYEKPPPGLIKENETKPEDCIPDVPGNESAREFLAHAPTKGLWMPLGKEVKVMQCWRCKRYGHRTGDKECPFFIKGNQKLEQFRVAHEDPMYDIIRENKRHEKEKRIQQLKQLLEDSTSESDSSDDSEEDDEDGSSSTSSEHKHKKKKRKKEKKKKEKKKKKKRKRKSSKSNEKSESD
ncbi:PREDICTED: retinitis pigmentosa 9 protein [Corvus brachyrhynchos]|nr:PREDICTED: retinitis pigmentosa 9 protein [Corvus brachyrhynchos]